MIEHVSTSSRSGFFHRSQIPANAKTGLSARVPFAEWRARYTTYLKHRGMYRQGTTFRMDREQRPCVTSRDSHYISTLRQVHSILENAYDDRPEHEKDVWNLQRMVVPISLSLSNVTLSFHRIRQP